MSKIKLKLKKHNKIIINLILTTQIIGVVIVQQNFHHIRG